MLRHGRARAEGRVGDAPARRVMGGSSLALIPFVQDEPGKSEDYAGPLISLALSAKKRFNERAGST